MTIKFSMNTAVCGGLLALAIWSGPVPGAPVGSLVISEVFYDRVGADNGFEWVELFNGTSVAVDLSMFGLGFAGNDYADATFALTGAIGAGEYFVVGGPESDASNGSPLFDLALDISPDIQNSGATADGIALFDLLAQEITPASVPIDAVIYGGANVNGLIDATGAVSPPMVGDAPNGASIERISQTGWAIASQPSPGSGPLTRTPVAVPALPAPGTGVLFALGLCLLLMACPRMKPGRFSHRPIDVLQRVFIPARAADW